MVFENKFQNKVILIAALDWGLGHASRCIPIIQTLKQKNQIIIACTESQKQFFDDEFPDLPKESIVAYNISYSKRFPLSIKLLIQLPKILFAIRKEYKQVNELVKRYQVNLVISDNRFGFYSTHAYCIYITHQINIIAGIYTSLANRIHSRFMAHFNELWIPDYMANNESLAGKLSRNTKNTNVKYIGPLSRLKKTESSEIKYDYLCLLSGPEPQRTLIESILYNKAIVSSKKIAFVRGTRNIMEKSSTTSQIDIYDMPDMELLSRLVSHSEYIVCRSGYSTLMDAHILGKDKLILIPTPGQTEQEYLANYWKEKYHAKLVLQEKLVEFEF